jgi:hypothetical protein
MVLVTVPEITLPPHGYHDWQSYSPFVIDAAAEKVAFIFRVPKAGSISSVGFRLGTVTTGQALKASLQDVDTTTGNPDGVVDQSGTVAVADSDDNTWKTVTFGSARVVVRNDILACVIEFNAAIGNLEIQAVQGSGGGGRYGFQQSCYVSHFTAAWAKQTTPLPCLDIVYNDGSRVHVMGNVPVSSLGNSTAFNNTSTPDEWALRFKLPVPVRARGAWVYTDPGSGVNFDVVLYDSVDTVKGSFSVDGDITPENGAIPFAGDFASDVDIAADEVHRLSLKPTTGTDIARYNIAVNSNAVFGGYEGGIEFYLSSRTDAGAWTDDATKRPPAGLIINGIDNAAASAPSVLRAVYMPIL